jgi:hypothetical protein
MSCCDGPAWDGEMCPCFSKGGCVCGTNECSLGDSNDGLYERKD